MGDFYLDPGIPIKQEPISETSVTTSASMPIPVKRVDIGDYRDLSFDLDASQSPNYQEALGQVQSPEYVGANTMWGTKFLGTEMDIGKGDSLIHMDDDDIFQVDKADLIQGPTLAELNANDENLLGDLNFDDLLLPEENTYNYLNSLSSSAAVQQTKICTPFMQINNNNNSVNNNTNLFASSCPQSGLGFYKDVDCTFANTYENYKSNTSTFSPTSHTSSNSSLIFQSTPSPISPLQLKHSTLHELLKRDTYASPERSVLGQSVPGPSSTPINPATVRMQRMSNSRLSSSAPTHISLDQLWQRREPRKHLLSTGSLVEAGSTSSLSTGGVLSPEAQDLSHDEFESDEDSDHYEDFSSDNGDSDDDDEHHHKTGAGKKERFFWQYNVQAKGPKGQRLMLKTKTENPHVLNEVTDPVFSPDCAVRGIKHSGKARKGDGNDLTPNPRKLYNIGKELDKLGKIINDMTPVSELPFNVRPKTRKEKNKLASRACRLKKKAQHEANKIKLQGLEHEHKKLISGINQAKQILVIKLNNSTPDKQDELSGHMDKIVKSATKAKIAGQTTDYVNKILEKVKSGGINITMEDCL